MTITCPGCDGTGHWTGWRCCLTCDGDGTVPMSPTLTDTLAQRVAPLMERSVGR
jgi:DnaJ-class molecular chaperone